MKNIETLTSKMVTLKLIPANLQKFLLPIISLVSLVILFVITVSIGYSRISSQLAQIEQAKKDKNTLTQKESFLREVDRNILTKSDSVVRAVPYTNSALFLFSQLKILANQKSVVVSNLKAGSDSLDPNLILSFVDVSFDVDASSPNVFDFIKATAGLAPLSNLQKATLTGSGAFLKASVVLRTFFSPLPEKLPSLADPVSALSNEEIEIIAKLDSLSPPALSEVVAAPAATTLREDPFAY